MVDVYPLKALRFSERFKKEIPDLISPPYDIISDSQKEELKKLNANNIVKLILPEKKDDRSSYENASDLLNEMLEENILEHDIQESFYIFEEHFYDEGTWKSFKSFIGLNKIEEYDSSKVLRHEYTLSKPKEDRLNLLRHTNTNFGLIYTLYDDADNEIQKILDEGTLSEPLYDFKAKYDPNLRFRIWRLSEKDKLKRIRELMKNKKILIADGHHRYETSRLFMHEIYEKRNKKDLNTPPVSFETTDQTIFPEEAVLTLFVNYNQENIKILPTHRMIKFKEKFNLNNYLEKIEKYFFLEEYSRVFKSKPSFTNEPVLIKNLTDFMNDKKNEKKHSFCLIDSKQKIFFITLKKEICELYPDLDESDYDFENLDVRILHRLLIDEILNDNDADTIHYTHTFNDLVSKVVSADTEYDLGIILNAPEISDVQKISGKGKIMPQKSTYFYPKPCSGLIMYKMDL